MQERNGTLRERERDRERIKSDIAGNLLFLRNNYADRKDEQSRQRILLGW